MLSYTIPININKDRINRLPAAISFLWGIFFSLSDEYITKNISILVAVVTPKSAKIFSWNVFSKKSGARATISSMVIIKEIINPAPTSFINLSVDIGRLRLLSALRLTLPLKTSKYTTTARINIRPATT